MSALLINSIKNNIKKNVFRLELLRFDNANFDDMRKVFIILFLAAYQ